MPPQGRHQVHIGPSLVRSIKARKMRGSPGAAPNGNGNGTTKRSNIPEREFYAFRCKFSCFVLCLSEVWRHVVLVVRFIDFYSVGLVVSR